jgi:probable rRNA maturation factor
MDGFLCLFFMPIFLLANHQAELEINEERFLDLLERALPLIQKHPGPHENNLREVEEVEINVVDDLTIAVVHEEFMGLPDPTDVITFQHGEILVSATTAQRVAEELGHGFERELFLYMIHGLFHLNGHEDHDPNEAAEMARLQDEVLGKIFSA